MLKYYIDLQNPYDYQDIPNPFVMQCWIDATLAGRDEPAEVCLRVVDAVEMQSLNAQYRQKDQVTNVLSFPFEWPEEISTSQPLLGDIIICAPQVALEATAQDKTIEQHWAHLFIHSLLHLLGYDHICDQDAQVMESLEIRLLTQLGYPNPYEDVPEGDSA